MTDGRAPSRPPYNAAMEDRSPGSAQDAALRSERQAGLRALALDEALATPLLAYLALLARWNRTYNLTAVREPQAMVARHLLDSLAMHAAVAPLAARGG